MVRRCRRLYYYCICVYVCDVYMQVWMYTLYTHRYCTSVILYFVTTCKRPLGPSLLNKMNEEMNEWIKLNVKINSRTWIQPMCTYQIAVFSVNGSALYNSDSCSCFIGLLYIAQLLSSACRHNCRILVANDNRQQHRDGWWIKDDHRAVA